MNDIQLRDIQVKPRFNMILDTEGYEANYKKENSLFYMQNNNKFCIFYDFTLRDPDLSDTTGHSLCFDLLSFSIIDSNLSNSRLSFRF